MNSIQNYQVSFQASNKQKVVRTLKERKEVNKLITNVKKELNLSKQGAKDLFEVNAKTTPKEIIAKKKTIYKNLDELWEELKNMKLDCNGNSDINEGIIDIIR